MLQTEARADYALMRTIRRETLMACLIAYAQSKRRLSAWAACAAGVACEESKRRHAAPQERTVRAPSVGWRCGYCLLPFFVPAFFLRVRPVWRWLART